MALSSIISAARRIAPAAVEIIATLFVLGIFPGVAEARRAVDRPGTTYGGKTSAKWPMLVQVSSDRRQVSLVHVPWEAKCSDGEKWYSDEDYERLPLSAKGGFRSAYDTGLRPDSSGGMYRYEGSIAGRLSPDRSKITGTISVSVTLRGGSGAERRCDTGKVSFTLRD